MHDTVTVAQPGDGRCLTGRPRAHGKFLFVGEEKLYVRGVTYGTFRPDARGDEFPEATQVESDFALMAAHGVNAVRTYTVPPRWVLDAAWRRRLRVMVGLPWEQHVDFLSDRRRARDIERRVCQGVQSIAGHPAVLGYSVGNEIPAPIVRWLGRRRVEGFIRRLYDAAKGKDPGALVTYVNYPTAEYLSLPFLDFVGFNVYLESRERLEAYLARLHNLVGDRPLLLTELGLDSRRNGDGTQSRVLDWKVRTAFGSGCAGAFVFSWTDEWHRGGYDIEDWDFGLTRRDRSPKPALAAVTRAFADVPFPRDLAWPTMSVVLCSYNGARTIRQTLGALQTLEYPAYEVIVVDDGSTDDTAAIAREFPVRLITTANAGLSAARNTGLAAAAGEIVAYIDDDAYPDPHWLTYLADTFRRTSHVGVGGPNIAPTDDGPIAGCVARAPGGPTHVLLADREAEHIPGCNMAFRREALVAIGGFDPQFRVAGDDVDVCWRLQERGGTLGFHPGAVVWHHRRNSVRAYLRQQVGYGEAEAMVERKWPEKYNAIGHPTWGGRIYANWLTAALRWSRSRIYHGTWGGALFQTALYRPPGWLQSLVVLPEWYLVIGVLAVLSAFGAHWSPLLAFAPLLGVAVVAPIVQAGLTAAAAQYPMRVRKIPRLRRFALTTALHLLQPLARLWGRLRFGRTPWRRRVSAFSWPGERACALWSERWRSAEARLHALETVLRQGPGVTRRGGDFDRWDLEVRGGLFGAARTLMVIEEHGAGKQLVRFRIWPCPSLGGVLVSLLFVLLATGAAYDGARLIALALAVMAAIAVGGTAQECAGAVAALSSAAARHEDEELPTRTVPAFASSRVEREVPIPGAAWGAMLARPPVGAVGSYRHPWDGVGRATSEQAIQTAGGD
jgi:GT2 family glycosyltransferase